MYVVMLHADIRNAHSVSTIVEWMHLKSPAGIVHKHIKDITDWCNTSEAAPPGPVSSEVQLWQLATHVNTSSPESGAQNSENRWCFYHGRDGRNVTPDNI